MQNQRGYAMAALLVAMSIMAIMMTVVMPVWKHAATREKEEELIFRGQQYARAIGLFQRKFANAYPPNIEVLVDQKFLRKKFKDPITNDDFAPLPAGQAPGAPGQPGAGGQRGGAQPSGRGQTTPGTVGQQQPAQTQQPGSPLRGVSPIGTPGAGGGTTAGISGVTSKSKDQSIRLYNGRNHYNEWAFVFVQQVQAPGADTPGSTVPGGVPGRPGGPGTTPRGGSRTGGPFDNPGGTGRGGRGFGPGSGGPGQVPIMPPGRGR